MKSENLQVSYRDALKFWTKLGFISFGGPAGQIAIMHEYLVERYKWLSEYRFMHALNFCMLLPGPEAQQLATYSGWLLHGVRGGITAGVMFILPSVFIMLALSILYVKFGSVPWVYSMFSGLKPAVIAIIVLALIRIGRKSLHTVVHYAVAISAFVCIYFFDVSYIYIIIFTILFAGIVSKFFPGLIQNRADADTGKIEEEIRGIAKDNGSGVPLPGIRITAGKLLLWLLLWSAPFIVLYFAGRDFEFWKDLILFFTKAAFVTFGGAYAVLPYIAQISVEEFHWLSRLQMLDGLALGETTPGPLIMVLSFVGFMAGYNQFEGSLISGMAGLIITTYYTFLPCFFFIFIGAPLIERTHENDFLKKVLGLVTAAVVGVILNLALYFSEPVFFPSGLGIAGADYISIAWFLLSLLALSKLRINLVMWIGISSVFGLLRYFMIN